MTDTLEKQDHDGNVFDGHRLAALAPAQIDIGDRKRGAKPHRVKVIAADMQVPGQGQLQPILVEETDITGRYLLLDGLQRLEAVMSFNGAFIEAKVRPMSSTPELRRYAQIMANVNREELTKLERAEYLAELRDVWQRMNPSAQHGGDRRSANVRSVKDREAAEENQSPVLGLLKEVADKVGLGRTQFFIALEISKGLFPATKDRIRDTWIADHQAGLQALAKENAALSGTGLC